MICHTLSMQSVVAVQAQGCRRGGGGRGGGGGIKPRV